MTQLDHGARNGDEISFGEIIAMMGEIYLVGLTVLVLIAAMTNMAGFPAGIILVPIDDRAIAVGFTA